MYWYEVSNKTGANYILDEIGVKDKLYNMNTTESNKLADNLNPSVQSIISVEFSGVRYIFTRSEYHHAQTVSFDNDMWNIGACRFMMRNGVSSLGYVCYNQFGQSQAITEEELLAEFEKMLQDEEVPQWKREYTAEIPTTPKNGCSQKNPECNIVKSSAAGESFLYCRKHELECYEGELK